MKLTGSISNQIFDELITTLEVIGIDRTIKTLQDAKANSLILEDLNIEFILSCVNQVTGVSKERILNGNDRNDERKIAIALCVYFIKKEFFYSYGDMSKIFKKDESSLSEKLKFWKPAEKNTVDPSKQYRVKVEENADGGSKVTIVDKEGNVNKSSTANVIINLLYEQLK